MKHNAPRPAVLTALAEAAQLGDMLQAGPSPLTIHDYHKQAWARRVADRSRRGTGMFQSMLWVLWLQSMCDYMVNACEVAGCEDDPGECLCRCQASTIQTMLKPGEAPAEL